MPFHDDEKFNLGWLVGIFDGEGSFGTNGASKSPLLRVGMTDEDTIDRVEELMPGGHRYAVLLPSGKTSYYYHLTGERAYNWMGAFHPYMCKRRQGQIDKIRDGSVGCKFRKEV